MSLLSAPTTDEFGTYSKDGYLDLAIRINPVTLCLWFIVNMSDLIKHIFMQLAMF